MNRTGCLRLVVLTIASVARLAAAQTAERPFEIQVVDDQSDRGVPLVELQTVHGLRYFTDSNGIVAFDEPGLMHEEVFFHVRSHGYEFPQDGFGYRGKKLTVAPGGHARLAIHRLNIAQRLYRVTGAGIYRDSLLVGRPAPIREPLLNGKVLGSDSVLTTLYHGKIYWFWGDTKWPAYPLGNFGSAGATSALPAAGGLDPRLGVDLAYFLDEQGRARPTAPIAGEGPTWLSALVTLGDDAGRERMVASYAKIRPPLETYRRGLVEFDDAAGCFRPVVEVPLDAPIFPSGQAFVHRSGGVDYVYFADPYPLVRVRAARRDWEDLSRYEAFTCLRPESRVANPQFDRRDDGSLLYGWKRGAPPINVRDQAALVRSGRLKPGEGLLQLCERDSGKPIQAGLGSVYWNAFRQRFVLIVTQIYGTSPLGEVWYAEADTPVGPWVYAVKIATHDNYSFYNPKQHPLFDADGGRTIFFEGTYTRTFTNNPDVTPRYDYNQVMYLLELADPRLALPVPIYALADGPPSALGDRTQLPAEGPDRPIAFFAPDRPLAATVPIYQVTAGEHGPFLTSTPPEGGQLARVAFYALPAATANPPAAVCPLYEFRAADGRRAYSTAVYWRAPGFGHAGPPIALVWRNPQ
jgi:hypothetical protein